MPPANDTTAPISVTSSQSPNTRRAKQNAKETYGTAGGRASGGEGGGGIKLAALDQYVFLLWLISPVWTGRSEQI